MAQGTPLTEQHIKELNDIATLPPEHQQQRLQLFLKTLTPEQIEFLKKQQGGECLFCSLASGKIPSQKIYEDDACLAVLDIRPAAKGHVLLFPKKHYQLLGQMSDVETGKLFVLANKLSRVVFETVQAEGTNIYVASGAAAGQTMPHVVVHIIPRWKNDKVVFSWEGQNINENEMKALYTKMIALVPQLLAPPREEIKKEAPHAVEWNERKRIP